MGIFDAKFVGIYGAQREALHAEAYATFLRYVAKFEREGANKSDAEEKARPLAYAEFMAAHPELRPSNVLFVLARSG